MKYNFAYPYKKNTNPIPYLLIDNNLLSRILDHGINDSLLKLRQELLKRTGRTFQKKDTQLIFGPSSYFEFAGLAQNEFVKPEELRSIIASIDQKLDPSEFIIQLFKAIEATVEKLESLKLENFVRKFEDKLPYLPKDSEDFVMQFFINPLKTYPQKMKEICQDLAFHLLCSSAVPEKHVGAQHVLGIRLTFAHFKTGNITSIAKHLPRVWQRMRSDEGLMSMSTAQKNEISRLIAMHETRDYLDSDLVHLAVTGYVRSGISRPVYCLTEDSSNKVKHRVLLYKILTRTLAQSYRDKEERPGEREYKDLDFKHGRVVFVGNDLQAIDDFSVQKLKKIP